MENQPANAGHRRHGSQSLGQEDPLEEDMATLSSILARRIPWTEEPGKLQSLGVQRDIQDCSDLAHVESVDCLG